MSSCSPSTESSQQAGDGYGPPAVLFDIISGKQVVVDRTLFPNAISAEPKWWKDGGFTSLQQRGHQAYRIIEVTDWVLLAHHQRESKTYIEYNSKTVFEPLNDGREMSGCRSGMAVPPYL